MPVLLALAACRDAQPPVERIAFLTLDNLTGDPSLDWMRRAVPSMAAAQLTGAGGIVPLRAESVRDAYNGKATHFVHGYYERRGGKLRFIFFEEDAATHKMTRTVEAEGDPLTASNRLAKQMNAQARSFSTSKAEAVTAWGQGNFERAVALDPDFSTAWLAWVQQEIAANRREQALAIARRALERTEMRSPVDRAQIALAEASLRNDPAARTKALTELVRLVPNDVVAVRTLAEQEMNARRFSESAQLFREALRIEPSDPFLRNLLGYALFYSGDLAAARREFDEYAKAPGHEANALDSQGEVLFMAGQFREAEQYFLKAHEKGPNLLGGMDLSKAAYARWLGGDLTGADEIFENFLRYRSEHGDPAVLWRRAVWEYATGRQEQAKARLMAVTGPVTELAQRQLQVWNNPESLSQDLARFEQIYLQTPPSADGLVRTLYARALVAANRREEARTILALWPLPETGEPLMQAFVFPLYRELRQAIQK